MLSRLTTRFLPQFWMAWEFAVYLVAGYIAVGGIIMAVSGDYWAGLFFSTMGWVLLTDRIVKARSGLAVALERNLHQKSRITIRVNLKEVLSDPCLRPVHAKNVEHLSFEEWSEALVAATPERQNDSRGDHLLVSFQVAGNQLWVNDDPATQLMIHRHWVIHCGYQTRYVGIDVGIEAAVEVRVAVVAGMLVLQVGGSRCFDEDTAKVKAGASYRAWETLATVPMLYLTKHHLSEAFMYLDHFVPGRDHTRESDKRQQEHRNDVWRYRFWRGYNHGFWGGFILDNIEENWRKKIEAWKAKEGVNNSNNFLSEFFYNSYWTVELSGFQTENDTVSDWVDRY
jgi:hypothetical protein